MEQETHRNRAEACVEMACALRVSKQWSPLRIGRVHGPGADELAVAMCVQLIELAVLLAVQLEVLIHRT
jgi:hypothetical protein